MNIRVGSWEWRRDYEWLYLASLKCLLWCLKMNQICIKWRSIFLQIKNSLVAFNQTFPLFLHSVTPVAVFFKWNWIPEWILFPPLRGCFRLFAWMQMFGRHRWLIVFWSQFLMQFLLQFLLHFFLYSESLTLYFFAKILTVLDVFW